MSSENKENLYWEAMKISSSLSVTTKENSIVLFSVSYLPTKENKEQAHAFLKKNPDKIIIDNTPCGKALMAMNLDKFLSLEEVCEIWKVSSKRLIEQAKGGVVAFVKGADPRSVFYSMELPELLKNENITTINGIDKFEFYETFTKNQ
ncbi:MAG: hypothetical protein ACK5N8_04165 [Alphaproteobacteria bacterium]